MCGCMLMHATMNHTGQQPVVQSTAGVDAAAGVRKQRCKHCGYSVDQDFSFCPSCGARLQTAPCPACGQKVESSWGSCAYCGFPLGEAQAQPAPR